MKQLKNLGLSDDLIATMIDVTTELEKAAPKSPQSSYSSLPTRTYTPTVRKQAEPKEEENPVTKILKECATGIAAYKACDVSGGFLKSICKTGVEANYDCVMAAKRLGAIH